MVIRAWTRLISHLLAKCGDARLVAGSTAGKDLQGFNEAHLFIMHTPFIDVLFLLQHCFFCSLILL